MSTRRGDRRGLMTGGGLLLLLVAVAPRGGTAPSESPSGGDSAPASGPVVARSYAVTDLGTLGSASRAEAINNRGQVVGYSYGLESGRVIAFIWDRENGMRPLNPPDWLHADAFDINDAGQAVGGAGVPQGSDTWFWFGFFGAGTHWLGLAPPAGWNALEARGVNEAGQVVGTVSRSGSTADGNSFAFLFDGATIRDLTPWVGARSIALDINNAGQVVGSSGDAMSSNYRAFLYDGVRSRDLGTLGGSSSLAYAINDRGHVVGISSIARDLREHAFFYDGVMMHDLGDLDYLGSGASDVNIWDQVVGDSEVGTPAEPHAFLYSNGVMTDLNDLIPPDSGWVLSSATGLNDGGQIVGWGRIRREEHPFLLDPRLERIPGSGSASVLRVEPDYVQFGDQAVGVASAPRQVRITNTDRQPLAIESVTISGPWSEEYAIVSGGAPGALAPGESRTVQIAFTPKAAGRSNATLEIRDDASTEAQLVPLYGLGAAPALRVGVSALGAPGDVDFGDQPLGTTSAAQTLTLTNTGGASLKVRRITLDGPQRGDFKVAGPGGTITLPPNASRSLTVRFTPMSLGARGATLRIEHSADPRPYLVALTGTGTLSLGDNGGNAGAAVPRKVELWIATGSAAPTRGGKIRLAAGQSVTLRLRVQYPNGATADVTDDPRTRFVASPAGGLFSPANVWRPGSADAGRSFTLSGESALWQGIPKLTARTTVTVRSTGKTAR
jgi:probable HAF family extracellular repeat protein